MANLAYKDTVAVIKDFKDFINNDFSEVSGNPIVDPLTGSGVSRGSNTGLAVYEDETKQANYPKITFETIDISRTRMAAGKSLYTERIRHEFGILYTCHKNHVWTYDNIQHKGKQQCIRYLQYLGDKIKQYSGSFAMKEIVVGGPSNPVSNPNTHTYTAFMVVKADSFGKIGA